MTTKPLVSIIIPTHNRKSLLSEAIDSCLAQSYSNIEILIIDDGSTDDTEAFIRSVLSGAGKTKVSYTVQVNGGACNARNHGLRLAQGEYIQFLDSDDVLLPDKISRQISAATAGGVSDVCVCYGRSGPIESGWDNAQRIGYLGPDYLEMLCSRCVFVVQTSAPLWRKTFLEREMGWNEQLRCAQDWEYYIRLFAMSPTAAFVGEDLFWLRSHHNVQIRHDSKNAEYWLSQWRATDLVIGNLSAAGLLTNKMRNGLLSHMRTNYINILRYCEPSTIIKFENWVRANSSASDYLLVGLPVCVRRMLGTRLFLVLYRLSSRITAETNEK